MKAEYIRSPLMYDLLDIGQYLAEIQLFDDLECKEKSKY